MPLCGLCAKKRRKKLMKKEFTTKNNKYERIEND